MKKRRLPASVLILAVFFTNLSADVVEHMLKGVDYASQTGFYDVNKVFDGNDDDLCWAFAASNQLQRWQDKQNPAIILQKKIPNGHSGAQSTYSLDIAYAFASSWLNNGGGITREGFEWWITGKPVDEDLTHPGGYWKDYVEKDRKFVFSVDLADNNADFFLNGIKECISKDYGLALAIEENPDEAGQHAITLWGYGFDLDANDYWIYITDSDDHKTELVKTLISYNDTDKFWHIEDASSPYNNWNIADYTYFTLGVVPEASAFAALAGMLALGLAAFTAARRKR